MSDSHATEFRRYLEQADVTGVRRVWDRVFPHIPQPVPDGHVLMVIHHTRTQSQSIPLRLRAWSHRWLLDHDYPSGLPDELKPKAERMYPRVVEGVGISVSSTSGLLKPVAQAIQGAMSDAVLDAYADKKTDPVFVKRRMMEARERQRKYFAELLLTNEPRRG